MDGHVEHAGRVQGAQEDDHEEDASLVYEEARRRGRLRHGPAWMSEVRMGRVPATAFLVLEKREPLTMTLAFLVPKQIISFFLS